MATLKVNDAKTPSQAIIDEASRIHSVTDARGRVIEARRLGSAGERRLLKAISFDPLDKKFLYGHYKLVAVVTSIDGDPISPCTNELQLDALWDRLGEEGLAAVSNLAGELFLGTQEGLREAAGE